MGFSQIIAVFHIFFDVVGLPGNFLVIITIFFERGFHVMRYILLASLALSDIFCLILTNSFRIVSIWQERWRYGETMCFLQPAFVRYFYLNTVLHLAAVSYERYSAIVKSPLTYEGAISKSRILFLVVIWLLPISISIGPFIGWGQYVHNMNPEVFFCEQGWSIQSNSAARTTVILAVTIFAVPFLVLFFLNWKVFKVANIHQDNLVEIQERRLAGYDRHEKELHEVIIRRLRGRKAAVDVNIIIAAFLLCFLPGWITGLCRQFIDTINISAQTVQITTGIFFVSSLCNPVIYSVRKREFRCGVKKVFKKIGVCGCSNKISDIYNASGRTQSMPEAFFMEQTTQTGSLPNWTVQRVEDFIRPRK